MKIARRMAALDGWSDVRAALAHPAFVFLCCVEALAFGGLLVSAHGSVAVDALLKVAFYCVPFIVITVLLTSGAPAFPQAQFRRVRTWRNRTGFSIVLATVVVSGLLGLAFNGQCTVVDPSVCRWIQRPPSWQFGALAISGNEIVIPLLYLMIPATALLLLGARWREIGFGRGYRSWRVMVLWAVFPSAIVLAMRWYEGRIDAGGLAQLATANFLQNGLMEEFLFRGALMTRLLPWLGTAWSIVLSSLAFGLWHFGADSGIFHAWLPTISYSLLTQGMFGVAFAVVTLRTRNLMASSIAHVLTDMAGG